MTRLPKSRIIDLDHSCPEMAAEIQRVMMASYQIEADLLGVKDFWPLQRKPIDIAQARSKFMGAFVEERLGAVVEVEANPVTIASLVVRPEHFRTGLGNALVNHVIESHFDEDIKVSTGIRNAPATALYCKVGFKEHCHWSTPDGIPMVTFLRKAAK